MLNGRLSAAEQEIIGGQAALQAASRELHEARHELCNRQSELEQTISELRALQQASRALAAATQNRNERAAEALVQSSLAQTGLAQPDLAQPVLVDADQDLPAHIQLSPTRSSLARSSLGMSALRASTFAQSQLPPVVAPADEGNALAQSIIQFAWSDTGEDRELMMDALEQLAKQQAMVDQLENQPPVQMAIWTGGAIALLRKAGGALMTGLSATVYQAHIMGHKIAAVVHANIEHDHPWKQKKYETAIKEFKQRFLALCPALFELRDCKTELGKEILRLLVHLYAAATDPGVDYRSSFYQLVMALRAIIKSEPYVALLKADLRSDEDKAMIAVVRALCHCRYAEVQLFSFCEKLVENVIAAGSVSPLSPLISLADFEAITNAPVEWKGTELGKNIGKIKGHTNVNFDPSLYCNVPFVLGDMSISYADGSNKLVRFLRMAVPTIQSLGDWDDIRNKWKFIDTEIDPIWLEFLEGVREEGKRHLYVSFQNDIPRFVLNGDESRRNQVLKNVAENNPAFILVILAKDSPFYHQTGAFGLAEIIRQVFIEQFMGQLMGNSAETGFHFPVAWKAADSSFAGEARYMLQGLLEALFPASDGGSTLNKLQRENFIEIFEACLFLYSIVKTNADITNGTCKDAIDRAMETFAILLELFMIATGVDDAEARKVQKTYTHAPAFMVKKQAMVKSRRDRLLSAFTLLQDPSVRKRVAAWLQVNRNLFGIRPNAVFGVVKNPSQTY